jgi:hypothetical protein
MLIIIKEYLRATARPEICHEEEETQSLFGTSMPNSASWVIIKRNFSGATTNIWHRNWHRRPPLFEI